jgi:hypothetical protein
MFCTSDVIPLVTVLLEKGYLALEQCAGKDL